MTPDTAPRPDLLDSLFQSCWLVESARAMVLGRWGGEFASEGENAAERARRVEGLLEQRGAHKPERALPEHAAWIESVVGARPDQVPLGAGLLQRLSVWTDVYMTPHLGAGAEEYRKLGESELRFPTPPRHITPDEVHLPPPPPPAGRRFVVFTDVHIGSAGAETVARHAVEDINALDPEFVLVPGDITEDGERGQYEHAKQVLDGLKAPCYAVLGNHDAVQRSTQQPVGGELFAEAFGEKPVDRVIDFGDVQVALVDSTDPTPSPFPDWDLARGGFREDAGGVNNGALEAGQAEALAANLDPDRPALLVMHHELQPFSAFPPVMFGLRDEDSRTLLESLAGHNVLGLVAGHTHRSAVTTVEGGLTQVEVPSSKDWPYCYTVVSLDHEGLHVVPHQISQRELVWSRAKNVAPIYLGYVFGPRSSPHHTFEL